MYPFLMEPVLKIFCGNSAWHYVRPKGEVLFRCLTQVRTRVNMNAIAIYVMFGE